MVVDFDINEFVASNSRLNTFARCKKKYEFKYVHGWEPKAKVIQLERGSWLHRLLQVHYNGDDWLEEHKRLKKEFYKLFEEEREELGDIPGDCLRIMRAYLRYYHDDHKRYHVIDTELDETVTLPNGMKMRIIIDLIWEDLRTGLLFAFDHKSRDKFEAGDNMLLDPQLTRYYRGLYLMGYKPLGGVGYNELRTKPPAIPALVDVKRNPRLSQRKDIDTDVYTYMREIRRHGFDPTDYASTLRLIATRQHEKFFKRTILPKDKPMIRTLMQETVDTVRDIAEAHRTGRFQRTYDKSCKWGCPYKDMCIADLHGADITPMVKMSFTTREQRERIKRIEALKAKKVSSG